MALQRLATVVVFLASTFIKWITFLPVEAEKKARLGWLKSY